MIIHFFTLISLYFLSSFSTVVTASDCSNAFQNAFPVVNPAPAKLVQVPKIIRHILHITDLHLERGSRNLDALEQLLATQDKDIDLILIGGDNGNAIGLRSTIYFLKKKYPNAHIAWVKGNHDLWKKDFDSVYSNDGVDVDSVHYLESTVIEFENMTLSGSYGHYDFRGGDVSIPLETYDQYKYERRIKNDWKIERHGRGNQELGDELANKFKTRLSLASNINKPLMLLFHTYPFAPEKASSRSFSSAYAINTKIGEAIIDQNRKPELVFVGHTHSESVWNPHGFNIINPGSDYQQVQAVIVSLDEKGNAKKTNILREGE